MRHLPLLLALLAATSLPACSSDPEKPNGELGRLGFQYEEFGCFDACRIDQPLAVGAHATVKVLGDDSEGRYRARSRSPHLVVEKEALFCMCTETTESGSSGSSIPAEETCFAPARKHCDRIVHVVGGTAGNAVLEMLGASDEVVDRVTLSVVQATSVEPVLEAIRPSGGVVRTLAPLPDGSFEIDAPVKLVFSGRARDAEGRLLRANRVDFHVDAANVVLRPYNEGETYNTFTEAVETTGVVRGLDRESSFVFRVVAP